MAAITGDTSATYTKDSGQKIYKEISVVLVQELKLDYYHYPFPQSNKMKHIHSLYLSVDDM